MTASQALVTQIRRTRCCTHPIRMQGRTDTVDVQSGELRALVASADQPGGVLLLPCRNRRSTVCPSCADAYRGDAWQLIASGLRGGKGVGAEVSVHPRLFVTLTAPSFGEVHSRRVRDGRPRRCRTRRSGVCAHGMARSCSFIHDLADPVLGRPLCAECFSYDQAVLWNAQAGQLWNRTVINLRRALARELRLPAAALRSAASVSFVKVVEYQARGVVHLHAVVRLDGPTPDEPAPAVDQDRLAVIVRDSAAAASVPLALPDGSAWECRWGPQLDVRVIPTGDVAAVAAYIAKYATKSTDANGALDRPIRRRAQIDRLPVNAHLRRLVHTCWQLGGDARYRKLRLRAWAHALGYRGHWTTKSRAYSTTFKALREARVAYVGGRDDDSVRVGEWRYVGRGYDLLGA
ncbi:MAG TPA: replication initiator [Mycobacteriales bacterium]|nr:replication initiator [Mycobacteriales bacterium]